MKLEATTLLALLNLALLILGGTAAVQRVLDAITALGVRIDVAEKSAEKTEQRVERLEAEKFGRSR